MTGPEDDPEYAEKMARVMQEVREEEGEDGERWIRATLAMPATAWAGMLEDERQGIKSQGFLASYLFVGAGFMALWTMIPARWSAIVFALIFVGLGILAIRAVRRRIRRFHALAHAARPFPVGVPEDVFNSAAQAAADQLPCPDEECNGVGFDVIFHAAHMHFRCRTCGRELTIDKPPGMP